VRKFYLAQLPLDKSARIAMEEAGYGFAPSFRHIKLPSVSNEAWCLSPRVHTLQHFVKVRRAQFTILRFAATFCRNLQPDGI